MVLVCGKRLPHCAHRGQRFGEERFGGRKVRNIESDVIEDHECTPRKADNRQTKNSSSRLNLVFQHLQRRPADEDR